MTITWKYAAGDESAQGFKEGFEKGGGKVVKELNLPFPDVEFQALLTEIAALKPDARVRVLRRRRRGQVRQGLRRGRTDEDDPAVRPGLPHRRHARSARRSGAGPVDHAALRRRSETPKNKSFRLNYAKAYKLQPDVYAVQGYDAAQLLAAGLNAVKGDIQARRE